MTLRSRAGLLPAGRQVPKRIPHLRGSSGDCWSSFPGKQAAGQDWLCSHLPHALSFLGDTALRSWGHTGRTCWAPGRLELAFLSCRRHSSTLPGAGTPSTVPQPGLLAPQSRESAWGCHTSWKHSSSHAFPQVSGEDRFFILADT